MASFGDSAPAGAAALPLSVSLAAEEAGMNAASVTEQRWLDGWLLRHCPVKAKRSRCIYPLAAGRLPLAERLARARACYEAADLPLVLRLPARADGLALVAPEADGQVLDEALAGLGLSRIEPTFVMAHAAPQAAAADLPAGLQLRPVAPLDFAELIGSLRGSPAGQREAHARRLASVIVPHQAFRLEDGAGSLLACGQFAREADRVGLFDIFVPPAQRGRGLAGQLCAALLGLAAAEGARLAYLQVSADNHPAVATYRRLGFGVAHGYHYRCDDPARAG
ncbi:MAG: hypothetical protein RL722_1328 [Pseudomonadota bacterium]|jgi:ribosomal protein S18 acetylase RimI-like enzyme